MSRTITAMFETRADAEAGKERLRAAGVDASNVHVHDQSSHQSSGSYSTHQDRGTWAAIKNAFLPDEDRHTYEEGFRRGHAVLTADVADDQADDAVRALEEANSIDVDERAGSWRQSGWDYQGGATGAAAGAGSGLFSGRDSDTTGDRLSGMTDRTGTEEVIPVVEEQLVVGKREADGGTVALRRLGSQGQEIMELGALIERLRAEATPPDLSR